MIDAQFPAIYGGIGADLASIHSRATPENPSFDLNSEDAWNYLDAKPSLSGVSVTAEIALRHSPWWRGVNLLARDVGKMAFYVYKDVPGGRDIDKSHPAYKLLRWESNPYQTALQFRMQLTGHAIGRGNGYALIERFGNGKPKYLWPLDPSRTYPVRDKATGIIKYVVESDSGPVAKFDPSEIIHIKGLSFDGLIGYCVIDLARDSVGLGLAQRKYCEVFYRNAVRPSVVLEAPNSLSEAQVELLRKSWERLYTGVENLHKTAILLNGVKANPLTFSAKDAEINDARKFDIREVANWLNVPPHKLGDDGKTSFSSLEQENRSYVQESLDYWLCTHELEYRCKLLSEDEKTSESHHVEADRDSAISTDTNAKGMFWRTATGGRPWATPDEARHEFGLPPLGGDSAELLTPSNFGQGGDLNDPLIADNVSGDNKDGGGKAKPEPDTLAKARQLRAFHNGLTDCERRANGRIGTQAMRAARDPKTFLEWLDSVDDDHRAAVTKIFEPVCYMAQTIGIETETNREVDDYFASIREQLLAISGDSQASELAENVRKWAEKQGVKS